MSCHNHTINDCENCLNQVKGRCVFYQGATLSCLDVVKGDNYDDILAGLNQIICDLTPPSGTVYEGTTNQIDINGNVISLSSTVTSAITNLQNVVSQNTSCISSTVKNITSSSLTITNTNETACGKTLNIEYSAPTPSQTQGIVYNQSSAQPNVGNNYKRVHDLSSYNLSNLDEIEIKLELKTNNISPTPYTNNLITVYDGTTLTNGLAISDRGGLFFLTDATSILTNVNIIITVINTTTNKVNIRATMQSYGGITTYETNSSVKGTMSTVNNVTVPLNSITVEFGNTYPSATSLEQYTVSIKRKI